MNSLNRATPAQSKCTPSDCLFSDRACDHTSYPDTSNSSDRLDSDCLDSDPSNADRLNLTEDKKFELMSAYLDDEVSDQERRLVEYWLANDPQLLSDYQQQIKLRGAIQTLDSNFSLDLTVNE